MCLKIDNSSMYSKPNENCPRCNMPLNVGMVLCNTPANCKEYITYPYMNIGESMHFECYLHKVLDFYLQNKLVVSRGKDE